VRRWAGLSALALLLVPLGGAGQTPTCDRLVGGRHELALRLLTSEFLYECCDDTIARCLEERPACPLAVRLAENVCRRVAALQDEKRIRRSLSRRARSMTEGGPPALIDTTAAPTAGTGNAPVTVVVYACARCPYCSKLVPVLYHEVTKGALRGTARLVFRAFPIRGHQGSTEAGLAFVAAAEMGKFWPYLLRAYSDFDSFDAGAPRRWAAEVGLDADTFTMYLDDPRSRESLVASKKEGLANGVEETPTLFLDGRRWVGELEIDELVDAIEEEAARVRGKLCAER
jgi:protein-disulfide isomerase